MVSNSNDLATAVHPPIVSGPLPLLSIKFSVEQGKAFATQAFMVLQPFSGKVIISKTQVDFYSLRGPVDALLPQILQALRPLIQGEVEAIAAPSSVSIAGASADAPQAKR